MKTIKLNLIAYLLSVLMLIQSCVAYNKTPVSVDEAVATNNKVKIYTNENEKHLFDKLVMEDGQIYGIKLLNKLNKDVFAAYVKEIDQEKGLVKVLIPFDIKGIHTKNKTKSLVLTLVLVLSPVLIPATIVGLWAAGGGGL
jgi:hypothetical protein